MLVVTTTELSAETRARILDAAWQRVRASGPGGVSVKAVAAAAGVSRQLVYFHFRNRAGLLLAMTRHHDRASGFAGRVAAAAGEEAVDEKGDRRGRQHGGEGGEDEARFVGHDVVRGREYSGSGRGPARASDVAEDGAGRVS